MSANAAPGNLALSISREDMLALPLRRYEGEVCVVRTSADLERARADLRQEAVVGFDTETRPAFRKGEAYLPCLVQAATAEAVYLFQLQSEALRAGCFELLAETLSAPQACKTGVALAGDLRQLGQLFAFEHANVVDLGVAARRHGLEQTGLRNLAGLFLRWRVPKGARTSNWAREQLSAQQIAYAATDAWVCRELYLQFQRLGIL